MQLLARAALIVAALVALPATTPVNGSGSGGRIDLDSVVRLYDSRVSGSGERVTEAYIGAGIFMVVAFFPDGVGSAVIHPCATPPPEDEATYRFLGVDDVKFARFSTAEEVCISSTVPIHVLIDREGTTSTAPELDRAQYVPLPTPIELWDARTTAAQQVVRIDRPTDLSSMSSGAVVSLEVLAADAPGFVQAYACSADRPPTFDIAYDWSSREANVAYVPIEPGDDLCVFAFTEIHLRVKLLGELAGSGPNPALLPPAWRYVPGEIPPPSLRPIVPERVLDTRIGLGRTGTTKIEPDEIVELDFGDLVGPRTTAVVLNVTVDQPESAGFVTAWPCGGDRPIVSNLNFAAGETVPNLVVSKLGPAGSVCLSGISRTHLIADVNGTFETDGGFLAQPVTPERILDTRSAVGVATTTKVAAGETLELAIGGTIVPMSAGAATLNITVTEPGAAGFVTAYPCDQPRPTASNLNHGPGQTVANLVTAKLSADGRLCLYTLADTHLLADIAAWYGVEQPAGLIELAPERFLDTRDATGVATTSKVAGGEFIALQIAGVGEVATDADAVVVNLTVTEPEGAGFVTAWPCDESMPVVSNLNYTAGETNPNLATVKLSATGSICVYTLATAHLLADVAGYLTDATVEGQQLTLQ